MTSWVFSQCVLPSTSGLSLVKSTFHDTVFESSRNRTLISCIGFMRDSFSVYALWRSPGRLPVSVREHARFIKYLAAGDLGGCLSEHERNLESGLKAALAASANERDGGGKLPVRLSKLRGHLR